MKFLIGIYHPAHFHFFKNIIKSLKNGGHEVKVIARDKEITKKLLSESNISYEIIGKYEKSNFFMKVVNSIKMSNEIRKASNKFRPDLLMGVNDTFIIFSTLKYPKMVFTDDDRWILNTILLVIFSTFLVTPLKFRLNLRNNHIKYRGYHELSYLHPNNLNMEETLSERPIVIFRLVGWGSAHDILHNKRGISKITLGRYMPSFTKNADVFMSSELETGDELQNLEKIPISEFHTYLHKASLVITDSQTTATEAALIGTPVIRCNSWVGDDDFTNFIELENKYKLLYNFNEESKALNFGLEILSKTHLYNSIHKLRLKKLLSQKVDVSEFVCNMVTNKEGIKIEN